MKYKKQAALVARLYELTNEGKLEWKPAAGDNCFQVSFPNYSVRISPVIRRNQLDYSIEIVNEEGNVADSFVDVDLVEVEGAPVESWYHTLSELYKMARRSALGADKALDAIMNELDNADDTDKKKPETDPFS